MCGTCNISALGDFSFSGVIDSIFGGSSAPVPNILVHGQSMPATALFTSSFASQRTQQSLQDIVGYIESGQAVLHDDGALYVLRNGAEFMVVPTGGIDATGYKKLYPASPTSSGLPIGTTTAAKIKAITTDASNAAKGIPAWINPALLNTLAAQRVADLVYYVRQKQAVVNTDGSISMNGAVQASAGSVNVPLFQNQEKLSVTAAVVKTSAPAPATSPAVSSQPVPLTAPTVATGAPATSSGGLFGAIGSILQQGAVNLLTQKANDYLTKSSTASVSNLPGPTGTVVPPSLPAPNVPTESLPSVTLPSVLPTSPAAALAPASTPSGLDAILATAPTRPLPPVEQTPATPAPAAPSDNSGLSGKDLATLLLSSSVKAAAPVAPPAPAPASAGGSATTGLVIAGIALLGIAVFAFNRKGRR